MPQPSDLTTLNAVKLWCQGNGVDPAWTSTASDAQLGGYITAASRAVLTHMHRPNILSRTVNELRDGTRTGSLILREYPVTAITQLAVGNIIVPVRPPLVGPGSTALTTQSPSGPVGYVLDPWDGAPPGHPQALKVDSYLYNRGQLNVAITYTAGYAILGELVAVPISPFQVVPAQPYGRYAADIGVTYANGTALTKVASGTPGTGQYIAPVALPATLSAPMPAPFYLFAAGDVGVQVLISYSYAPYDLEHAVTKWIGEWWSYRLRIGEKSKALPGGQGTATFDLSEMPDDVKLMVKSYRRMVPI